MKKKLFKFAKAHIYIFGVLANVLPLIGLIVLEHNALIGLHSWQAAAWIFGAIYYFFMWPVAIVAWKKLKSENKDIKETENKSQEVIKELTKRIIELEKKQK